MDEGKLLVTQYFCTLDQITRIKISRKVTSKNSEVIQGRSDSRLLISMEIVGSGESDEDFLVDNDGDYVGKYNEGGLGWVGVSTDVAEAEKK